MNISGPPQKENINPINLDLKQRNAKIRTSTGINLEVEGTTVHESLDDFDNTIKVHINTVKPYTGYGSGQYIISSVKQMSTTTDFLGIPNPRT